MQRIKGIWRVRIVVPLLLVPILGKTALTESTGTRDKEKAILRAAPIIAKFQAQIAGPPIEDDEIEALAEGWWQLFQLERSRQITNSDGAPMWPDGRARLDDIDPKAWALASDDDLSRWVRRFISGPREWRYPQAPDATRDKVESFLGDLKRSAQLLLNVDAIGRLLRNCRILHHLAANDYVGQGDDRKNATFRILDMIERLETDPRQILAAIAEDTVAPTSPGKRSRSPHRVGRVRSPA
jgi:hypothetical protein